MNHYETNSSKLFAVLEHWSDRFYYIYKTFALRRTIVVTGGTYINNIYGQCRIESIIMCRHTVLVFGAKNRHNVNRLRHYAAIIIT